MSSVIRDAIIRLRLEQQKSKIEAPDTSALRAAYEGEKKAAEEAAKATAEATAATREHANALADAATKAAQVSQPLKEVAASQKESAGAAKEASASFGSISKSLNDVRMPLNEAGEGAMRFAKGLAFLSASGEEDMKKLAQAVAAAQGTFDVLAGGAKVVTSLSTAFGPAGMAVGGLTLALGAGALAWHKWASAAAEAAKAVEEAERKAASFRREDERRQQGLGEKKISLGLTDEERQKRVTEEQTRLRGEFQGIEAEIIKERGDLSLSPDAARAMAEWERAASSQAMYGSSGSMSLEERQARITRTWKPQAADIQDVTDLEQRRKEVLEQLIELEKQQLQLKGGEKDAVAQAQKTLDSLFALLKATDDRVAQLKIDMAAANPQ